MAYIASFSTESFYETRQNFYATRQEAEAQAMIDIVQEISDFAGDSFCPQVMSFKTINYAGIYEVFGSARIIQNCGVEKIVTLSERIRYTRIPLPPRPWTLLALQYWIKQQEYPSRHDVLLGKVALLAGECLSGLLPLACGVLRVLIGQPFFPQNLSSRLAARVRAWLMGEWKGVEF